MSKVIFEFPDSVSRDSFLAWFSNSGEQDLFVSEECHAGDEQRPEIRRFDYAKAFPAWGYDVVKHGEDKTVIAQYRTTE